MTLTHYREARAVLLGHVRYARHVGRRIGMHHTWVASEIETAHRRMVQLRRDRSGIRSSLRSVRVLSPAAGADVVFS